MNSECIQQIEACLSDFRQGALTEAKLAQLLESARASQDAPVPRRQSLLYMQVGNVNPSSGPLSMTLYEGGRVVEMSRDPQEWPYHNVLHAIADGWRVIAFPNLALLTDPVLPQGLGCEFVLEKWE